ncbi:hypothetical protein QCE47_16510 [Caballeronia sp. LZ025]|nr:MULTISPECIES: hypothetical protein [Caballeronia]MDR5733924.1 hypothetical protein [Caballeronia sp. LZ025]
MLTNAVSRYVELHRAMGFKYLAQDRLLRSFAVFVDAREDGYV